MSDSVTVTESDDGAGVGGGLVQVPAQGAANGGSGGGDRDAIGQRMQDALCKACYDGELDTAKLLLFGSGTSPTALGVIPEHPLPRSPLSQACAGKQLGVVRFLLTREGVTADPAPGEKYCPQFWAVPSVEILREFSVRGLWPTDPNGLWKDLCTNSDEVILRAAVADLNSEHVNDTLLNGDTPLHVACTGSSSEFVMALLELGADLYAQNDSGRLPIHVAYMYLAQHDLVLILVEAHSQPDSNSTSVHFNWATLCDNKGFTPLALLDDSLDSAIFDSSDSDDFDLAETKKRLIDCGGKLNGTLADGETTALEIVYDLGSWGRFESLIAALHDDFKTDSGVIDTHAILQATIPTLWRVVKHEHEGRFATLVDKIWHSDEVDLSNDQAVIQLFCYCARRGFLPGIKLLLEKEESLKTAREECTGYTALDCAVEAAHATVVDYLRSVGAETGGSKDDFDGVGSAASEETEIHNATPQSTALADTEIHVDLRTVPADGEVSVQPPAPSTVYTKSSTAAVCGATLSLQELATFKPVVFADILPAGVAGSGSFGVVQRGWYQGRPVAYKLKHREVCVEETLYPTTARFTHEARVLRLFQQPTHDHCLAFLGVGVDPAVGVALVTEYVGGGSLKSMLRGDEQLDPVDALSLCAGLASGLFYIHETGIIHGDIKPANILLEITGERIVGKVIDFGGSVPYWLGRTAYTALYAAPEVLRGEFTKAKSDVFSLACVFYEVLTCNRLDLERVDNYALQPIEFPEGEGVANTVETQLPDSLRGHGLGGVLSCCWSENAADRLTSSELCTALLLALRDVGAVDRAQAVSAAHNSAPRSGNSPLMAAVQYRKYTEVSVLLKGSHAADHSNRWGQTPVHVAAAVGDVHVLNMLLGTQPELKEDNFGVHPVDIAAELCLADLVTVLREYMQQHPVKSADTEAGSDKFPLHAAAARGDTGFVKAFVEAESSLLVLKDSAGRAAIDIAIQSESCDVLSYLLTAWCASAGYDGTRWDAYVTTAYDNNENINVLRRVMEVFVSDYDARESTIAWRTCLFHACRKRSTEWVKVLSACIDKEDESDLVLFVGGACREKRWDVVGALVGVNDPKGELVRGEALMLVCARDHATLAALVVASGADVDYCDAFGRTPLIAACEVGSLSCVNMLAGLVAEVSTVDSGNRTALTVASERGFCDVVKVLLMAGTKVNFWPVGGETALHSASRIGHLAVVELLLGNGANVNAILGELPLLTSSHHGHSAVVRVLLDHGADVDGTNNFGGGTALTSASQKGHADVVEILLEHDADVNATRIDGLTALMCACSNGEAGCVRLLLDAGADLNVVDKDGYTALSLAKQFNHAEVVRILEGAMQGSV